MGACRSFEHFAYRYCFDCNDLWFNLVVCFGFVDFDFYYAYWCYYSGIAQPQNHFLADQRYEHTP